MSWFSPAGNKEPHSQSCSSPPSEMGRRIRSKRQNSWVGIKQFNRTAKVEENNNTHKKDIQHAMFSPLSFLLSSKSPCSSQLPYLNTKHDVT